MNSYYIWTIGCQMNRAESERLKALVETRGYEEVETAEQADLIVINSCVVRESAENRVVNKLARLKSLKKASPDKRIALTGCFVSDIPKLRQAFPFVDYFFGAGQTPEMGLGGSSLMALPDKSGVSAIVPVMQGCDNFCSYCIVPYRRGREVSRPEGEIIREASALAERGAGEIILVGQNVDSYGKGLGGTTSLADLLERVGRIEKIIRIRFLHNHPKDISPDLARAIKNLDKVCPQLNLPVQAGDDEMLRRMNRGYDVARYKEVVAMLRECVPDIAITTDVIVGFPGESRRQFENTLKLMEEIRFDGAHIAAYSPRAGTAAARFTDDVSPAEKKYRLRLAEDLQAGICARINAGLIGRKTEVLVEGRKKGKWYGRTGTDKLAFFTHDDNWLGRLVTLNIERASAWSLTGIIVENNRRSN